MPKLDICLYHFKQDDFGSLCLLANGLLKFESSDIRQSGKNGGKMANGENVFIHVGCSVESKYLICWLQRSQM